MNIHEHQAKEVLREYGAPVSQGVVVFSLDKIKEEVKKLSSKEFVLKAQIHAGGRGKAGGVKLVKNLDDLEREAEIMMGKVLITHQTGPEGKEVKRLYIEEASDISKEFYLSCLVDRESSKIAFISSTEGGMDIEKVASETPDKIITNKISLKDTGPSNDEVEKIINIINVSKTILWNGPAGYFENQNFANGSIKIAKNIIENNKAKKIFSVAGGGDTVSLLNNLNAVNDFNFVSTAGGAFLEYLEGKNLPGITALN